MHHDHVALAYMGQQAADGRLLRRDCNIDDVALHQVHVGRPVDQGHDLVRPQAFRQHAGDDVGLVGIGQGAEDVGVVYVFLDQEFLVRGVTVEDDGVVQFFSGFLRFFR